jgi:hypothetical protein
LKKRKRSVICWGFCRAAIFFQPELGLHFKKRKRSIDCSGLFRA